MTTSSLANLLATADLQGRLRDVVLPDGLPAACSNITATFEARVSFDIALNDFLRICVQVQAADGVFSDTLAWASSDPNRKDNGRDRVFRAYARLYVPIFDGIYGEMNRYEHVGVKVHNYAWLRHRGVVAQTTAALDKILCSNPYDVPEDWLAVGDSGRDYDMSQDHILWLGAQLAAGTCDLTEIRIVSDEGAIFDGNGRLIWMSPHLSLTTWREDIVATYGLAGAAALVDETVIASGPQTVGLRKAALHPKNIARMQAALAVPDARQRPTVYVDGDPETFAAVLTASGLDPDPFVPVEDGSSLTWAMLQRVAATRGVHPIAEAAPDAS